MTPIERKGHARSGEAKNRSHPHNMKNDYVTTETVSRLNTNSCESTLCLILGAIVYILYIYEKHGDSYNSFKQ